MSGAGLYHNDMWVDTINMVAFINEFTRESGREDVDISVPKIQGILAGMRMDFPHFEGQDKASPYKKAANFICYFNAERPLANPFPASLAGDFLHQVSNHHGRQHRSQHAAKERDGQANNQKQDNQIDRFFIGEVVIGPVSQYA